MENKQTLSTESNELESSSLTEPVPPHQLISDASGRRQKRRYSGIRVHLQNMIVLQTHCTHVLFDRMTLGGDRDEDV